MTSKREIKSVKQEPAVLAERLAGWEFVTVSELLPWPAGLEAVWLVRGKPGWSEKLAQAPAG